jgi:hypothetical protein
MSAAPSRTDLADAYETLRARSPADLCEPRHEDMLCCSDPECRAGRGTCMRLQNASLTWFS